MRRLLLDRAFFTTAVIEFLQQEKLPFLMPVMFRGRRSKKRPATGLHAIRKQPAGWYKHTLKNHQRQETNIAVCVSYRTHKNRKDGKRVQKKLLFAAWRVCGTPRKIRQAYRRRFGIETSYRQLRQANIYTCTRNPHLRLVFFAIALILAISGSGFTKHIWPKAGPSRTMHLERLRFKRLLDWIAQAVVAQLHDGSTPCVNFSPKTDLALLNFEIRMTNQI